MKEKEIKESLPLEEEISNEIKSSVTSVPKTEKSNVRNDFKWLSTITQFFGLAISLHFFLSYKWISSVFQIYKIEFFPLINIEDLRFTFVGMNLDIVMPSLIGFTVMVSFRLILSSETYYNLGEVSKNEAKETLRGGKEMLKSFLEARFYIKLIVVYVFMLVIIGIYFTFPNYNPDVSLGSNLITIFCLLLFISALYLVVPSKRNVYMVCYIFLVFAWSSSAINKIVKDSRDKEVPSYSKVEFEYKGDTIRSDTNFLFVHYGYQSTIMFDNVDSIAHIFPSSEVGWFSHQRIRFSKEKKK